VVDTTLIPEGSDEWPTVQRHSTHLGRYNQNLWIRHLSPGAAYLPR
jgi:hypothetical protein